MNLNHASSAFSNAPVYINDFSQSFRFINKQQPALVKKQMKPKITFKKIVDDVLDKKKWQEKWKKIK